MPEKAACCVPGPLHGISSAMTEADDIDENKLTSDLTPTKPISVLTAETTHHAPSIANCRVLRPLTPSRNERARLQKSTHEFEHIYVATNYAANLTEIFMIALQYVHTRVGNRREREGWN